MTGGVYLEHVLKLSLLKISWVWMLESRRMNVVKDGLLSDLTFAVVDVETTGLSARTGDRICELAVVIVRGGRVVDQVQTLVNPGRAISYGASAVNGITDSMVRHAPPFKSVAPLLVKALDGAVLVGHNASFDLAFLSAELHIAGYDPPSNPVVDTLALARRCYSFPSNKLGEVAKQFGIKTQGLHRALADATLTWHVLERILRDFGEYGLVTLADVVRIQGALTPLGGWGWHSTPPQAEWDGTDPACPIEGLPPLLEQAVRAHAPLRIKYKGSDGQGSVRLVEPRKVTLRQGASYLVAYCHLKREERTFRVDRILELRIIEGVRLNP